MNKYRIYYSTGHGMYLSVTVTAEDVEKAVDVFLVDYSPIAIIHSITEIPT